MGKGAVLAVILVLIVAIGGIYVYLNVTKGRGVPHLHQSPQNLQSLQKPLNPRPALLPAHLPLRRHHQASHH